MIKSTLRKGKSGLDRFAKKENGMVGILSAIILMPTITIAVGSFAISSEVAQMTRVQQTVDAAAVALANFHPDDRPASLTAWIETNSNPLTSVEVTAATVESERRAVTVTAEHQTSASYAWGMKAIPGQTGEVASVRRSATVDFFYRPLELVLAFDASTSQDGNKIKKMVNDAMNAVFVNQDVVDNVHISLLAYSDIVNLGSEYADGVISWKSRKLTPAGADYGKPNPWGGMDLTHNKPQALFDKQAATLKAVNPALVEDLLAVGGPGYDKRMAPVARPAEPKTQAEIRSYVDWMEKPPTSEDDRLTLVVGDGRYIAQGRTTLGTYNGSLWTSYMLMTSM